MSLTKDVAAAIIERGSGTLDTIAPLFPDRTRDQVKMAMKNAKQRGWVRVAKRGKGLGGLTGGTEPSLYEPLVTVPEDRPRKKTYKPRKQAGQPTPIRRRPERAQPRISAVWDLGQGLPVFALPGDPGRRFEPLGEW